MGTREIKQFIKIKDVLRPTLRMAHTRHSLSARSYHRLLKVSRTIADLAGSEDIEENHIPTLVQSAPKYSPSHLVQMIKSISAKEIFKKFPEIRDELWGWRILE